MFVTNFVFRAIFRIMTISHCVQIAKLSTNKSTFNWQYCILYG